MREYKVNGTIGAENHTITCIGTHEEVRKKNAYYRKAWEDYEKARNITYQLEGGEGNA